MTAAATATAVIFAGDVKAGGTEFKVGDRVTVDGWRGIAFYVKGRTQVWEPELVIFEDPETGDEYEEPTGDGEYVDDPSGQLVVVMVGDDSEHVVDAEDLTPIADDEYCGECGQVGCGWSIRHSDAEL